MPIMGAVPLLWLVRNCGLRSGRADARVQLFITSVQVFRLERFALIISPDWTADDV